MNSQPRTANSAHGRLAALDAMRGMAALMVVCRHASPDIAGLPSPVGGHLAVDLFFLLSGFVMAEAYDTRLNQGLSTWSFMKLRLLRLYPLYLVGFTLGALKAWMQQAWGDHPLPANDMVLNSLCQLFMLPSPGTRTWSVDTLYLFNPAAWSLAFELLANLLFAFTHARLRGRMLAFAVLAAGFALCWQLDAATGLDQGTRWHDAPVALARVAFSFMLGIWLARHAPRPSSRHGLVLTWLCAVLTLAMVWRPAGAVLPWELLWVIVVFPLMVITAAGHVPGPAATRLCTWAGDLSYPLYIVHMPALMLALAVGRRWAPDWPHQPYSGAMTLAVLLWMAWGLERLWDRPLRQYLSSTRSHGPLPCGNVVASPN